MKKAGGGQGGGERRIKVILKMKKSCRGSGGSEWMLNEELKLW